MKNIIPFLFLVFLSVHTLAQDTFSIVAVDPTTGEVGSAGASCVDLPAFNAATGNNFQPDFLGDLFPGVGAINTQAYWREANQNNARTRMLAGDSPQEIIDWLIAFDEQSNPTIRQYGVVRLIDNEPFSAAHTGVNTDDFKDHRTGPTYSIQGNILLNSTILINMESNFNNTVGTLADKLMAALQGANVVGADSRCASNGTSSLFAFLKVASPFDVDGSPSLVLGVSTSDGDQIEPIDSLQALYDTAFPSNVNELLYPGMSLKVYPQPATEMVQVAISGLPSPKKFTLSLFDNTGKYCYTHSLSKDVHVIRKDEINSSSQIYWYQLKDEDGVPVRSGKIIFQ